MPAHKSEQKEQARKLLEEQLQLEEGAVTMYNRLLNHFRNPNLRSDLATIRDDKLAHVELLKEALELAK